MRKVAIIGATGLLGRPVAQELYRAGFAVTALARDPEKARRLLPEGVAIVPADLKDRAALETALAGHEVLYLNLSVEPTHRPSDWLPEREGLDKALAAAKAAGIRRVVMISSVVMNYQGTDGFMWWVFDVKHEAVRKVKQSGLPYTLFYPSSFMENFIGAQRQGKRVLVAGESRQPMYYVAGADYGRQVAAALRDEDGQNHDYVVQGPEAMTADVAAERFAKAYTAEKLSVSRAPLWLLRFLGNFIRTVNYTSRIVTALNNYAEPFGAKHTWERLGKPTITLEQFAERVSNENSKEPASGK